MFSKLALNISTGLQELRELRNDYPISPDKIEI